MIKGVIFDWNGTLSDDIQKVFSTSMKTVARLGGRVLSFAEYRRMVKNPYMLFYRELGCKGTMADTNRWYWHYLAKSKVPVRLFPDAIQILRFLKANNVRVGIVSSHPTKSIKKDSKGYGILDCLDFIRGDVHTKGRHVRMFLERYRLRPREVIFVGDMVNDIDEGKMCGVITAAYLRGVDKKEKLLMAKPDIVLPNLSALKRHITTKV